MFYRKPCAEFQAPKIEVPKLTEEQLFIVSALSIIRATHGDLEAHRWLSDFERENLLPIGSLNGFIELLDLHCVEWN